MQITRQQTSFSSSYRIIPTILYPPVIPPITTIPAQQPFIDSWLASATGSLVKTQPDNIFTITNENCWVPNAQDIFKCFPISAKNGCLIQPQVVQYQKHYMPSVGQVITFSDGSSSAITKFYTTEFQDDQSIAILQTPLSTTPARLFNVNSYPTDPYYEPSQCANERLKNWKAVYLSPSRQQFVSQISSPCAFAGSTMIPSLSTHYEKVVVGFSGAPVFLFIDVQGDAVPVLVGLQYMSNMNSYSILSPFELPQTLSQIQNICQSEGITPPQYVNIP